MRPHLPVAAVVATVLFVFSSLPSVGGKHRPHSILVANVEAASTAVGARKCETNAFPTNLGGFVCYGPSAIRAAYGMTELVSRHGGEGQTIVILAAFGSPTAARDFWEFDEFYGLGHHGSFRV